MKTVAELEISEKEFALMKIGLTFLCDVPRYERLANELLARLDPNHRALVEAAAILEDEAKEEMNA